MKPDACHRERVSADVAAYGKDNLEVLVMYKSVVMLLLGASLIGGCVRNGEVKLGGCPRLAVPECVNNKDVDDVPFIDITIADARKRAESDRGEDVVNVEPSNLCVSPGDTIRININETVGESAPLVGLIPKRYRNTWLIASSASDPGRITLQVPDGTPEGDYDYAIVTSDANCVDPRLRVRN